MKKYQKYLYQGCFLFVTIGLAVNSLGAVHMVGDGGEFSTLQAAIDDAGTVNGDTIEVAAGTYTEVNITVSKSLTIQGAGMNETIVQAHATEGSASNRVFTIDAGVVVMISDMTVRHGAVTANPAQGGGIYNVGTLTLSKVKVCNNRATGTTGHAYGGGLYIEGTMTIDQCIFADNLTQGGTDGSDGYRAYGGGIYVKLNQAANFTRCAFSGNRAIGGTGSNHNGYGFGGAICDAVTSGDVAVITLINCTLSGNTANSRGGAIYGQQTFTFKHCTIANNSAPQGGGIFSTTSNDNTGPILYHTLIADNTATFGPDINLRVQSRGYNLIETDANGTIDIDGNGNTATGNIIGSDPMLTPLADFGGPTPTCALQDGSPALDQIPNGTNGLGTAPLNVDQRGRARPYNGNGDIGAYESSPTTPTVSTTAISNITTTSAETGGNVTNDGGAGLLARGVCWNTTGTPTIADDHTDDGSAPDEYTSSLTGLSSGTTYYVRAYATNSIGTAYGDTISFTTAKKNQVITFSALATKTVGDAAFSLTATASSGLAVTYTSSNTDVATISDSTVTIVKAGTTTITASQTGNATYNAAADVPQVLTVVSQSTAVIDENGRATINNGTISGTLEGFEPNLPVSVESNNGTATLTIGSTNSPILTTVLNNVGEGTTVSVASQETTQQNTIEISQESGRRVTLVLVAFPEGVNVGVDLGNSQILGNVTDARGQAMDVTIATADTGGNVTFIVTYHPPSSNTTAKTLWLALGGTMTIEALGVPADGVYKVAISYVGVPLGQSSPSDQRLMRVDSDGKLTHVGSNDRGDIAATTTLGDYGVDTASQKVWANVNLLGTFAVAVPKEPIEMVTTITSYGCPFMAGVLMSLLLLGFIRLSRVW
jgi:predicted outer membrane repeat protein